MRSSGVSVGDSLRVICGPTAGGKSALVARLAESYTLTVVSADSRQVYKGFDIGTAKPSASERALIPHHGIDVAEPTERYSAARWARAAQAWIADAEAIGRTPVVVGGTGFYIHALMAPLFAEPPLDVERRRAVETALGRLAVAELRRWCRVLDPARAHLGRTQLLRALEVALLTGVPLSHWHRSTPQAPGRNARYLLVDPGESLAERIRARAADMVVRGWATETAALMETVPASAPAWNSTGYAAVREWVCGTIDRDEALERVIVQTRQYAKRQRTWFRHQLGAAVTRLDPTRTDAVARARAWWEGDVDGGCV